jgi:hypothetical protein
MLRCSDRDLAERLNKPRLSMDCRVKPGNHEMESRSRDVFAPEFCNYRHVKCAAELRKKTRRCLPFTVRYAHFAKQ